MTSRIFELFLGAISAVVCVRNSYVAAVNREASDHLDRCVEGERLTDHMSALEALRFQAAFESRKPFLLMSFGLDGYCGCYAAAAAFQRIMSRRFAVVWLFRTSEECEAFCDEFRQSSHGANGSGMAEFIALLTSIPKDLLDEGGRYGLIDLKVSARRCVDDIMKHCGKMDCIVDVTENEEMRKRLCSPAPIPLGCFMQMLSGMLLCMSDISLNRIIGVRLCAYGSDSEIRMSTDALRLSVNVRDTDSLAAELPSCSAYLSLAEFAAGVCGCTLYLRRSEDSETVTLVLCIGKSTEPVDFKSRDQFAYYNEALEALMQRLPELIIPRKEEAQEEE